MRRVTPCKVKISRDLQIVLIGTGTRADHVRAFENDVRVLFRQQNDLAQLFIDNLLLLVGKDAARLDHRSCLRVDLE